MSVRDDIEALAIPAADLTTLTGTMQDATGQVFSNAEWIAIPQTLAQTGRIFFIDGTPLPSSFSGVTDSAGAITGSIGLTSRMNPSTFYKFIITTPTSALPSVVANVRITTEPTADLGAILKPNLQPLRVPAGPLVYAYSSDEIMEPTPGSGYVNVSDDPPQIFHFRNGAWFAVGVGAAPSIAEAMRRASRTKSARSKAAKPAPPRAAGKAAAKSKGKNVARRSPAQKTAAKGSAAGKSKDMASRSPSKKITAKGSAAVKRKPR
jgi:hypothetical protein